MKNNTAATAATTSKKAAVKPFTVPDPWVRVTLPIPTEHAKILSAEPPEILAWGMLSGDEISKVCLDDSVPRLVDAELTKYTTEMRAYKWEDYQEVAASIGYPIEDVLRYVLWRRADDCERRIASVARAARRASKDAKAAKAAAMQTATA